MIEFLMCEMKKHMDATTYESMLFRWGESSSNTEKMQEWVEMVQSIIGSSVYEGIKQDFRDMEEKKKERDGGMHCIQSFEKSSTVHFKKDIGAELTIDQDFESFKLDFKSIVCGLVDTRVDTLISMDT